MADRMYALKQTYDEGCIHHGARMARGRAMKMHRRPDGKFVPEIEGPDGIKVLAEYVVAVEAYGGVEWHQVYRWNHDRSRLLFLHRFPFGEEAANFIDDVQHGRERVFFRDTPFTKKAL